MADLSRRSFLRGALVVAAASVAPSLPALADCPTLYGDGVHDDTEALNALLSGKPVICEGALICGTGQSAELRGGTFLISDTIRVTRNGPAVVGNEFVAAADFRGDTLLESPQEIAHRILDNRFDATAWCPLSGLKYSAALIPA